MKLEVMGARCIVKEDKLEEKTEAGIIIPGREKEPTYRGTVIAVGEGAMLDTGVLLPMYVKPKDRIIYSSYAGSPIDVDGETYVILNQKDILAVLTEEE